MVVAGKTPGKATLTVTLKSNKKAYVTVTVRSVKTTKITGVKSSLVLRVKKTATLKPVLTPRTSTEKITYKSSNTKVATVTSAGKIIAKKKGTAYIYVKSGSKTVKCKVVVKRFLAFVKSGGKTVGKGSIRSCEGHFPSPHPNPPATPL